jgi:6-phosphogluconolactonase (cycloisomerase 2 family)
MATLPISPAALGGCTTTGSQTQTGERNDPGRRLFAYVGSRTTKERNAQGDGINVYQVDRATGDWSHVQLVKDLVNPSFLAFDRSGRFLYAVHGDKSEISAFSIDPHSGEISFINQQSTHGTNPVHLVVEPRNRFVIVANYATGSVVTLPLNGDGSLGPVDKIFKLPGQPGPHRTQQSSSHPHQVKFDRSNRYLLVPDKGLDRVFVFRFDEDKGSLEPNEPFFVQTREGAGPRHAAFHPNGQYVYVSDELNSCVTAYRYDGKNGTLHPFQTLPSIPMEYTGDNTAAGIDICESGRFLYVSNRGHDSLAGYAISAHDGSLAPTGWQSSLGKGPRFFTLDPSGDLIYTANENGHAIVAFRVDASSGRLSPTGQTVSTGSPVCIVFS